MLLKDLDVFARNSIKDELASLDPLLRNVGGWGGGMVGTGDEGGRAMDDSLSDGYSVLETLTGRGSNRCAPGAAWNALSYDGALLPFRGTPRG